jgi:galactokinase
MLGIFEEAFDGGSDGVVVASAPGRVNLIGEHTDYNDGFVLPVPLDRSLWAAGRRTEADEVRLYADDFRERMSFRLGEIRYDDGHRWANYVMGVVKVFLETGYDLGGADVALKGDVPLGAGLSSSAALEMATARLLLGMFDLEVDPVELAYMCKQAENEFVGVECGIMDQFVSALGVEGSALLIDCRTNEYEQIPLARGFDVVIVNTMVKRELTSSAYNERRRQCSEGVRLLSGRLPRVEALRDVSIEDLERNLDLLPPVIARRCRHVVSENARVLEAAEALRRGDMTGFGASMYESHESLRADYEVSCMELDTLVETARAIPGNVGARMTGAGFGGCTVNIVEGNLTDGFSKQIKERYRQATGIRAEVYRIQA